MCTYLHIVLDSKYTIHDQTLKGMFGVVRIGRLIGGRVTSFPCEDTGENIRRHQDEPLIKLKQSQPSDATTRAPIGAGEI